MAAGDRIFMAKESTSQEILSNTTGAGALNLRSGAGTGKDKKVLTTMQSGETCQCYGYYTDVSGVKWLYVAYKNVVGFASSKYLKK